MSTFLTDYVLLKNADLERALNALQEAGHHVILDKEISSIVIGLR